MTHLEEILKLLDQLTELMKNHDLPKANPAVLRKVQTLCIRMKGEDHYITEKADCIERLAEKFFSINKHESYPGGTDALHCAMTHDIPNRIRTQVLFLQGSQPEQT